jgi:ubiquinone/menaquinone biosynthesis C-methylase UbiE
MKTQNMRDQEILARQYKDSVNLDIRKNFHKKYSSNPIRYTDWILSNINFFKGCRILELGCGTGSLWENCPELINSFSELVLTDISKGMIDIVKERFAGRNNVRIQTMDVLDVPFENNAFDIIVANSMLYHVNNVDSALKNIYRILQNGGVFYATTFGKDGLLNYINNAMFEIGLSDSRNIDDISFTLENGMDILQNHFLMVKQEPYDVHLEVTETLDLVDYIFSMASMCHIDQSNREKMNTHFESKKDSKGVLTIPIIYGMFIAVK